MAGECEKKHQGRDPAVPDVSACHKACGRENVGNSRPTGGEAEDQAQRQSYAHCRSPVSRVAEVGLLGGEKLQLDPI